MQEATLISAEGHKLGTYTIICQKDTPPTTKHDVGEDIEFPGSFLEAELVGETPLQDQGVLTLLSATTETRVRITLCQPLPAGSAFFYLKVAAA